MGLGLWHYQEAALWPMPTSGPVLLVSPFNLKILLIHEGTQCL